MAINPGKFSLLGSIMEGKWIRLQLQLCCWSWAPGSYPITKPCVVSGAVHAKAVGSGPSCG